MVGMSHECSRRGGRRLLPVAVEVAAAAARPPYLSVWWSGAAPPHQYRLRPGRCGHSALLSANGNCPAALVSSNRNGDFSAFPIRLLGQFIMPVRRVVSGRICLLMIAIGRGTALYGRLYTAK